MLRPAQPISFNAATLFWTEVAVQHIFVSEMSFESVPTKAVGNAAEQTVASPKLRDEFHEGARFEPLFLCMEGMIVFAR